MYSNDSVFKVRKNVAKYQFKKSRVDTTYASNNQQFRNLLVKSNIIYVQALMCLENNVLQEHRTVNDHP